MHSLIYLKLYSVVVLFPMNRSNRTSININDLPRHFPNLDPYILTTIMGMVIPHWSDCIAYPKLFKNLFNIFIFFNFLGIFSFSFRIINYIFRFSIGTLFSTIGILWNEDLLAISYLRDFALFIKDYVDYYFNFKIPKLSTIKTLNTNINDNDLNNYISILSFLGLLILGIGGATGMLCLAHLYIPENISNIPYIGNIVELINTNIYSIYDYFWGNSSNIQPGLTANTNTNNTTMMPFPEGISRTSSGSSSGSSGSSITIRDFRNITPPMSRSSTPIPTDSNWD